MRKLLLTFLLLLLAPAWAEEADPNVEFVTAVMRCVLTGEGAKAAKLITADRPRALESFQLLVNGYPMVQDPKQQAMIKSYVNTVARVFEANGDPSLIDRLKAEGLLVEQPQPPPQSSPDPLSDLVGIYLQASSKAFRYGNFVAANQILEALNGFLTTLVKQVPQYTSQIQGAQTTAMVLHNANSVFSGMASSAIPLGEQLVAMTSGRTQEVARLLLLQAARKAARPQLLDKHLAPALEGLQTFGDDPSTPIMRFAVLSFAAERQLQKNPDLSNSQFLALHDEAWKGLAGVEVAEQSQGDGRFLWEATRIWTREESRRLATATGTDAQRLQAAFNGDLDRAREIANTSIKVKEFKNFNPEFVAGMFDFVLDVVEQRTELGRYPEARELLSQLGPGVQQYRQLFAENDKTHQASMRQAVDTMNTQVIPGLRQKGLDIAAAPLTYSLLDGDMARVEGRIHQVTVRLLMSETGGNLTESQLATLKQELMAAATAQNQARQGQTYLGMDDVNWDILHVLFTRRKGDWQADAAKLVALCQEVSTRLGDRGGMIATWSYDGELKAEKGDKAGAIASLQKATGLAEEYITETGANAAGAARLRSQYKRAYELLTRLQIETGQSREAYDTLGRMQQMNSLSTASLDSNPVMARAVALRGQTQALKQELAVQKAAGQDTRPQEQLLAQTKAEFHTALNEIRRANPNYESMLGIRPVNFSKQQGSIPADAAVIEYFPGEDGLYIFVVTREDLKIRKVDVKPATLQEALSGFRNAVIKRQDVAGPALRLHAILIDPVEADVAKKPVLAFIPTGSLNYLPFGALARQQGDRLQYLVERKQCVTLLKSSDLDQLGHQPNPARQGLLALGNPDGSLPAATDEVHQIAGLFGTKAFVGAEARREKLRALKKIAYLHLATHGTLDARDPAASYLLMAGKPEEARLLVPQIYELKLDGVRLVTLSACQTALGEREPGSELQTLADAFGVAGTNSVVASYWSVADDSTKALMVEFYKQLKAGRPLAQALNGAQLKLLQSPQFNHPFFWAPFVLIGDWR